MDVEELLKYEKTRFQKLSTGITKTDLDWLVGHFLKENPELADYKGDSEKERKFLSGFNSFIYCIHHDNPPDIRAYIEKKLKKKEYDKKLSALESTIWNLTPERKDRCKPLEKQVRALLAEAEAEFPGFTEARSRQVSHILGDLMAIESDGKIGSMRMALRLSRIQIAEKAQNKEKKS